MADYEDLEERGGLSQSRMIRAALDVFGFLVIGVSLFGCIYRLVQLGRGDALNADSVLATLAGTLVAVVFGVLFLAISEIVRRLVAIQGVSQQRVSGPGQWSEYHATRGSGAAANEALAQTLEELVVLTREVRDISLLTEEQRALRLDAQGKAVLSLLQREVPILLREHNWIEARNRVQEARERFPNFSEWDALEHQIEQMRAQVEAHDIEAAQRQIDDLTSLGAWNRVAEVVNELLERHPDSVKANEIAQRLRVQRHKAEAEQRARLMVQAQEAANNREWQVALTAATTLVQRFPKSPEAQALRLQLPTLRENAEIQARQQMESEIRDLIKAQRFEEALRSARELIQQYPNSPQAAVLREQLPRLEEKTTAYGPRY
jgi:outer membrane protein assembly factor BamD (BamD/ComL family)